MLADGSRYYNDSYNFMVYSGTGSQWGSHMLSIGNWYVYPEHQSVLDAMDTDYLQKDPHLPGPMRTRTSTVGETWPGACGAVDHTDVNQHSGVFERWEGNTCVTMSVGPPTSFECDVEGNAVMPATSGNTYRTPNATMVFGCHPGAPDEPGQTRTAPPNSTDQPLSRWQTHKNWDGTPREGGSRLADIPSDTELVAAAHDLLHF